MKYLKLLIGSAVVFFIMACIVSFFIPSQLRILRMTNIAPEKDSVLYPVRDLSQWKSWYPGLERAQLEEPHVEQGRVIKARVNDIRLEILSSDSNAVEASMSKGAKPVIMGWRIDPSFKSDSLVLQGYIEVQLKWYPWEKFSSLMLDKAYGDMMKKSLENLKNL
ncbi:hypothetical protein PIECOFPK_01748 [Mycovorax composti]|jgi:Polyketide cyclase / dehydrase and lipid transport.|uniref:Polyketide cyclase / dehydrase and lipid transport n=2 Tax=Chitinophagaceae TaxID=563835 RepID=A0ABZ2EL85_9BACT